MSCKFVLSFSLVVSFWSHISQAYFIASEPAKLQAGVPTDVFVAGFGNDQGTQFLKAAILGAKISRDRFPDRQRVIISAVNESFEAEKGMLSSAGFGFRKSDRDDLEKSRLVMALQYLNTPVSSLQFYGHANTYNGFRLQSKTDRLDEKAPEFSEIGKVLAPNAFVVFHSCNSGWLLAPAAAKMWRKPVYGSFASSDFQEPMTDGQWYYHDVGMYPDGFSRVGNTSTVVRESLDCGKGKCLRLKPVNASYVDSFGIFSRGLGFYKVFSPDESLIPQSLVHFTLLTPSVLPLSMQASKADLINAAIDWMCPSDKSGKRRDACRQAVLNEEFKNDKHLSFFSGEAIACTNTKCFTGVKCNAFKALIGAVPCKTYEIEYRKSTVFSDQMSMLFQGLDLFEKGQLNL